MDVAFKSFVGIDIAKRTLDVHVLPERRRSSRQTIPRAEATPKKLPPPGERLIVVKRPAVTSGPSSPN